MADSADTPPQAEGGVAGGGAVDSAAGGKESSPRRGRRRSDEANARTQILQAASREFLAKGYDAVSLRAIARRAGVDAGLVHHYFEDKAQLFTETMRAPIRPDRIVQKVFNGPLDALGTNIITILLSTMESGTAARRAIGLIRTALGHDFAATMLRQFLTREVFAKIADKLGVTDGEFRATVAATQVVGLLVVRYGVRAEPLASAPLEEVVRRIGPVIQWHLTGYPEALDSGQTLRE